MTCLGFESIVTRSNISSQPTYRTAAREAWVVQLFWIMRQMIFGSRAQLLIKAIGRQTMRAKMRPEEVRRKMVVLRGRSE